MTENLMMKFMPRISDLDYYISCIYKNLMKNLFKKALYAFGNKDVCCTAAECYEKDFKKNSDGNIVYVGQYDSSVLEKKELKVTFESTWVYCVLFLIRKSMIQ